ncbi:NERD domain-containing protein [Neobacillus sp. MER 74]|uniref:nuclease-related domain-containing protein n=1 Tax=Neobacillus sp. MER 74 TaxID=2939566 RepID=UPI0020419411|nr:nuclease-related domain-containing protein [Neobacillus sp. MER 74]MCM3116262.1 NERD domain-containing protein [Neobacillus sp. MER 74]
MKDRDASLTLEGLIAAQQRLAVDHSLQSVLAAKRGSVEAGIGGEERVADVFRKHPFSDEHHIFHDLSPAWREHFQMDSFVLTPWFGTVLEVKNIGGVLEFKDKPPQLIRTKEDGHQDGYESPVVQLERNRELISDWLWGRNIDIPIFGAVVLAYPKQIVAAPPKNTNILFPSLIPSFLKSIPQHGNKLDHETFNWLSAELLKSHRPFIPKPICETYGIPFGDFQPGVRCVTCGRFGMIKQPRTWCCPHCGAVDHIAHQRTLREWFLIFKRTITNRECREFLGVDDIHAAKRILLSMDMQSEGTYRDRYYFMDLRSTNQTNDRETIIVP